MLDVSGSSVGARVPIGSCPAAWTRRSLTIWRARMMSVPSLKTAITLENPWIDSERIDSRPPTPFTPFSTGRVTSCSTCSAERPGASVWMITCGGANSGKTSSFACIASQTP